MFSVPVVPLRAVLVALAWGALGVTGCTEVQPAAPQRPYAVGVYAGEDLPYPDLLNALPELARRQVSVMVAVPADRLSSPQLLTFVRAANEQGVELRLWPLLPEAEGYWPNETNARSFAQLVEDLLDWIDRERLSVTAIVYDMEPAISYSRSLQAAYREGLSRAIDLFRQHLDPSAFAAARDRLKKSVEQVHAAGLRAQCVTFPQVLDDLKDSDDDLQDALDIPVQGIDWDELSFMVYQSTYASMLGAWIGPGLIRLYAAAARQRYGERATIALGVVGKAGVMTAETELYPEPDRLAEDMAAALAEQITRLEVFSLDGMIHTGRPKEWLDAIATATEPKQPQVTFQAKLARQSFVTLDKLLDSQEPTPDGGITDARP